MPGAEQERMFKKPKSRGATESKEEGSESCHVVKSISNQQLNSILVQQSQML